MPSFPTQAAIEGINFSKAFSVSASTPEYPGRQMSPGIRTTGSDGSEWILCQVAATKACVANDLVVVTNHATWQIDQVTNTTARNFLGSRIGVAGATGAAGDYVWVQFGGYAPTVNIVTAAAAFTALHSSATAGRGTATASGGVSATLNGIVGLAAAASNVAACHLNAAAVGAND